MASSDTAPILDQYTWYPVAATAREDSYKGEQINSIEAKRAKINTIVIDPPAGSSRPVCEPDWDVQT